MEVLVIARFKNYAFVKARLEAGFPTQISLARASGISQQRIGKYENFNYYPKSEKAIKEIEAALKRPFEWLFPQVYQDAVNRKLGRVG